MTSDAQKIEQTLVLTRGFFGDIPTFCSVCKTYEIMEVEEKIGHFTKRCNCGKTFYRLRESDEGHPTAYFSKTFISKHRFRENFARKSNEEKMGFTAIKKGNKTILTKG